MIYCPPLVSKCKQVLLHCLLALVLAVLLLSPAWPQGFSAGLSGHEHTAQPGDVIQGSVRVSSMSDEPITLEITLGDFVRGKAGSELEGSYQFETVLGQEERSASPWVRFAPGIIDLQPGESAEVMYQISIPEDSSLTGSYWTVLFVQPTATEEQIKTEVDADSTVPSIGITIKFRYAIRIYVNIGNNPPAKPQFTGLEVEPMKDGLMVKPTLRNDGLVFIRPKLTVQLKNLSGEVVFQTNTTTYTLLPQSSYTGNIEARPMYLEDGEYLLVVIGDSGTPELIAAQTKVTLSGLPSEPPPEEAGPSGPPGSPGNPVEGSATPDDPPPPPDDGDDSE